MYLAISGDQFDCHCPIHIHFQYQQWLFFSLGGENKDMLLKVRKIGFRLRDMEAFAGYNQRVKILPILEVVVIT